MDSAMDLDVQDSAQNCRDLLAQLQAAIVISEAHRAEETIRIWKYLNISTVDCLIPELNHLLTTLEIQSSNPALETQLRSLNPEVTRLIKLLQIDWQFWQAARQADRLQQRQQQLLKHLQQLDQLLEAILHHLQHDAVKI
jgi:hypothetical protein